MALDRISDLEAEQSTTFRVVESSEFESAFNIIDACSDDLVNKGFDHWKSWYTTERVAKIIEERYLYGYYLGDKLVGVVKLKAGCPYGEEEFSQMAIDENDLKALNPIYLGTLGVHPDFQGKGMASKILKFAQDASTLMGFSTIVIDARMEIPGLIDFYLKRGFIELGRFSEGENQTYLIMKKPIK